MKGVVSVIPAFHRYEKGKLVSYERIVLALLQQCKDEGLSVDQALFVLDELKRKIEHDAREKAI